MENSSTPTSAPVSSATEGESQSSVSPSSEVSTEGQPKVTGNETQEELVELVLGSAKGKVPKALADAMKGLEKSSREAMRKSSTTEKQVQTFVQQMKANPRAALEQLGIDPYEFSEMTLAEKVQELQKPEHQRKLESQERELQKYKDDEKRRKEDGEKAELSKREQQFKQTLDNEIGTAFKSSGLPAKASYVRMVAGEMRAAALRGEDLSAGDACRIVKGQIEDDHRSAYKDLPPEALLALIGEENFKKLREYDVGRLTAKAAPTPNSGASKGTQADASYPSRRETQKPMNEREWRAHLQSLKG